MDEFTSENDLFWSGRWDEESSNDLAGWGDIRTSDYDIKEEQYEEIETAGEYEEIAKSIKSITDLLEKIEKNTSGGEKTKSDIGNQSEQGNEEELQSSGVSGPDDSEENSGEYITGESRETESATENTTNEYQQTIEIGINDLKIELQNTQKLMEQQILNDRLYAEVGIGVLSIIAGMIIVQIAVGRLR